MNGVHVHVKVNVQYLIALHFGFLRLVFLCMSILPVASDTLELELQVVVSYFWEPNTDPLQEQ